MLEAIFYIDHTINRASYSAMLLRIILLNFSQLGCISSMTASLLIQPNQAVQCYLLLRCVMCEPTNGILVLLTSWLNSMCISFYFYEIFSWILHRSVAKSTIIFFLFLIQMFISIHIFHRLYTSDTLKLKSHLWIEVLSISLVQHVSFWRSIQCSCIKWKIPLMCICVGDELLSFVKVPILKH